MIRFHPISECSKFIFLLHLYFQVCFCRCSKIFKSVKFWFHHYDKKILPFLVWDIINTFCILASVVFIVVPCTCVVTSARSKLVPYLA